MLYGGIWVMMETFADPLGLQNFVWWRACSKGCMAKSHTCSAETPGVQLPSPWKMSGNHPFEAVTPDYYYQLVKNQFCFELSLTMPPQGTQHRSSASYHPTLGTLHKAGIFPSPWWEWGVREPDHIAPINSLGCSTESLHLHSHHMEDKPLPP